MWYYILFAIVMFAAGRLRVLLISVAVLLIGPKIIVLAPIWILGVVLHRFQPLYRVREWQGWLLFLASWPLYGLFQHYEMTEFGGALLKQWVGEKWHRDLTFSKFFVTDYLLALIIAMNFVGYRVIAHQFSWPLSRCEKVIRWLAGNTFSLYVFHQPLLLFFAAVFNGDPNGKLFYLQVIAATLTSVVAIGTFTEQKRHHLRELIRRLLVWLIETKWRRRGVTASAGYGREKA
jgi:hypothetical protein